MSSRFVKKKVEPNEVEWIRTHNHAHTHVCTCLNLYTYIQYYIINKNDTGFPAFLSRVVYRVAAREKSGSQADRKKFRFRGISQCLFFNKKVRSRPHKNRARGNSDLVKEWFVVFCLYRFFDRLFFCCLFKEAINRINRTKGKNSKYDAEKKINKINNLYKKLAGNTDRYWKNRYFFIWSLKTKIWNAQSFEDGWIVWTKV